MASRDIYESTFDEDVPTTNSADVRTCPECDGRVQTNARESSCTECGLVLTEQDLDRGRESIVYDPDRERTGAPRTVARHDRGLSTRIGRSRDGKGRSLPSGKRRHLRRLRREHRRAGVRSKRERNERRGITEIRRLTGALELPQSIRDHACSLYQTAQSEDLLRGRSVESIAAASVYGACRLAELPRSIEEIAAFSTYSGDELRRRFAVLNVELSLSIRPLSPADYVSRYASELDVPIDVRHRALELARAAGESGLANGVAPNGMAGGCLYVAAQELGYSLTQSEVGSVVGVSATTIRARKEELLTLR